MTAVEIPTVPAQNQTFTTTLLGVTYRFTFRWNPSEVCWLMSLSVEDTQTPVLDGVPLVTGADLLDQYAYLGLGFALYVQSDSSVDTVPEYADLGVSGHLYAVMS